MATWFKVRQAAQYAGVSRDTIYTACATAELRHVKVGGRRAIRLKPEWVDDWLERFERETARARSVLRAA
jgi:excisionase family DNA binding protein